MVLVVLCLGVYALRILRHRPAGRPEWRQELFFFFMFFLTCRSAVARTPSREIAMLISEPSSPEPLSSAPSSSDMREQMSGCFADCCDIPDCTAFNAMRTFCGKGTSCKSWRRVCIVDTGCCAS